MGGQGERERETLQWTPPLSMGLDPGTGAEIKSRTPN